MDHASLQTPNMVKLLDPIRQQHVTLDLILAIVMVGLSLFAASELVLIAAPMIMEAEASAAALGGVAKMLKAQQARQVSPADLSWSDAAKAASQARQDSASVADKLAEVKEGIKYHQNIEKNAKAVNGMIFAAIVDAPFLARAIWPTSTADSQFVQLGDLLDGLSQVSVHVEQRLADANWIMMSDFDTFLNATQHGRFTDAQLPTVANETDNLLLGLKTYLFTTALQHNNYYLWTGPSPTDGLLATSRGAATAFGCEVNNVTGACQVDQKGLMGQPKGWVTYASNATQTFYTLGKIAKDGSLDYSSPTPAEVVNTAITSGWTTMDLLFDASNLCYLRQRLSNNTQTGPNLLSNGSVDIIGDMQDGFNFACIAQLMVVNGCNHQILGLKTSWSQAKKDKSACNVFFCTTNLP